MKTYHVPWEIDIDADNPRHAAELALETQRTVGSSAVVFNVIEHDSDGEAVRIDLDKVEPELCECGRVPNECATYDDTDKDHADRDMPGY